MVARKLNKMGKLPDIIIKKAGGKIYAIYRAIVDIDPYSGSDITSYPVEPNIEILAYIQPTGGDGTVKGIQLKNSTAGDSSIAEYFIYSNIELKEKDRIIYKDTLYEIRSVEPWESVKLSHYKGYLVKVDGQ